MKNSEQEDKKAEAPGCLPLIQIAVALFAIGYSVYIFLTV